MNEHEFFYTRFLNTRFFLTRIARIKRIFYCTRISRITRILVRSVALTVFEHESHELNEYFIAHGSHGSADFLAYGLLLLWNL